MKGTKPRRVHDSQQVNNYKELLTMINEKYSNNIAYKYKKDRRQKNPQYIEKTYKDFIGDIKALSTSLLSLGLEENKIALIGDNRYEWCVSYMAVTTGNMVVVPLDKALPDNEIEALIKRSESTTVIFDKKYKEVMVKIKNEKTSKVKRLICMDEVEEEGDIEYYYDLIKQGKEYIKEGSTRYEEVKIDSDKMSIMLFTSGTTSLPKAVMLSQGNICANLSVISGWVKIYPEDTLLSFLPLNHTFECTITFIYGMYSGATVAFCDGLKYIQKNLKEYEISIFVAVPQVLEVMYKKIKKTIKETGKERVFNIILKISNLLLKCKIDLRKQFFKSILENIGGRLRLVLYGAAPMNKETIIGYNNLGIELVQGYGLTETSPVIAAETDKEKRPGSVGLVFDNLELRIKNPDKEGVGEIEVKGPSIMLGYYKNEKATREALKDGWLSTGDYGYLDKDEFLYVTGRKADLIVLKNGKNVYPQEIEFLINKIPYVTESLVYQRKLDETDTMLCAKIVYDKEKIEQALGLRTEEAYKEELWNEIKEINKILPVFKHIKKITITTEPFAKTTTQKIKRNEELKKI